MTTTPTKFRFSSAAFACALVLGTSAASAQSYRDVAPPPGPYNPHPRDAPVKEDHTQGGWSPKDEGFVPVLRLGFMASGEGTETFDCEGELCGDSSKIESDYEVDGGFMLGADWLWHLTSKLRLGLSTNFASGGTFKYAEGELETGEQLQALLTFEAVLPVASSSWLTLRAQAGPAFWLTSHDQQNYQDDIDRDCEAAGLACDAPIHPRVGPSFGLGLGLLQVVGQATRLRVDLLGESQLIPQAEVRATGEAGSVTFVSNTSTTRLWVLAGIEL